MKKFIAHLAIIIASQFCVADLFAQSIAINTDGSVAHTSAILDIKSINKGMLPPRMTTNQRTAITTPATGLFVYDTGTNSFWFYNGSMWIDLSSTATSGWSLTGNSGVNATNNFIGTTDIQPLRFRVNNLWAGEINAASGNIFLGIGAGKSNGTGYSNTAFGTSALKNNIISSSNVAIGDSALFSHIGTTGGGNTAVGTHSMFSSTNSNGNTALGYYSLWQNSTGNFNTAIGLNTLSNNIDGFENTAVGSRALQFNDYGRANTATGASALRLNSLGEQNTANGYQALYSNTYGNRNTASGFLALSSNTVGEDNTAIGAYSLYANVTGVHNVAIGISSLYNNSGGVNNTALGYTALYTSTSGDANVAVGAGAMYNNNGGSKNIAIGTNALSSNIIGRSNTAIGYSALGDLNGGNLNIAIGENSGTSPGSPGVNNTISIGNNDILNAASNQAFIGNGSTNWIGGQVGWFHYSDARIKTNIKEEVMGLDFILRLRPVTYNKNLQKIREITGNKETSDFAGKYDIEKIKFSGFLAQEVEKAAKESGYDFDGVHKPQNEHDLYSLSYAEFVVPLVKAVQEQQTMIKTQQQQIDLLLKRIEALEKK